MSLMFQKLALSARTHTVNIIAYYWDIFMQFLSVQTHKSECLRKKSQKSAIDHKREKRKRTANVLDLSSTIALIPIEILNYIKQKNTSVNSG